MSINVEKIGGTSMSRLNELLDTLFTAGRKDAQLYGRVFMTLPRRLATRQGMLRKRGTRFCAPRTCDIKEFERVA